MATKTRFATWREENGLYKVKPPGWPKDCEISFTRKSDMINWSHNAGVMLKDTNAKGGKRYANFATNE